MDIGKKMILEYWRASLHILALVSKQKAARKAFELFCTPFESGRKKKKPFFEKGEKIAFDLEGMQIKGYRWNHPQDKKLLIVHGFSSNVKNFYRYVLPLVQKGYEVIAFDAPAHGRSGGKQINLPLYVNMLQQVNEKFGPIRSYLSHSFGGLAVMHLLEKIPHSAETRVVLIAPATETTTAIDAFFRLFKLDEETRQAFDELIFEKSGVWPSYFSIRRAAGQVQASVLWVHDKQDKITPFHDALAVQKDNHSHFSWMTTEGLGHRRIYRDPEVVERVCGFL